MGPEAEIERQIRKAAILEGWKVYKVRFLDANGAPDRVFGRRGRSVWIEFKAPGQQPSKQQELRHREMREAFGLEVHWCDTADHARYILGLRA